MLHGELNTGKAKTVAGHGCESAGVSHVAGIALGMGGQRAQGQDYTDARAGVQSQDLAQHCARPPAAPPSLSHFPANLSSYSHGTLGLRAWHKWHTFPHLLWAVPKDCSSCWVLCRSTSAIPPSPALISCASLGIPQCWNSPETVDGPLLLCQNS